MRLKISQQELDRLSGNGGLEIVIEGCTGDPLEKEPGTSVYIEKYEGKVQVHVWDGTQADCQTIILKEIK
ncbi:MAG: hypothetical protein IMZ61_09135 [Planctomycetes bacterium]|nr:hypothetical protein [Planctomycetota bacterium]